MIKERPILFNSDMVRAVLDGRKKQTRRIIKPSKKQADGFEVHFRDGCFTGAYNTFLDSMLDKNCNQHPIICPYGKEGDILWVRENYCLDYLFEDVSPSEAMVQTDGKMDVHYIADDHTDFYYPHRNDFNKGRTRPSIHMPKKLSRIKLKINRLWVERVQDITWQYAKAEGIKDCFPEQAVNEFANLWDSINKDRGYGWSENPWVWCVEFEKIK